MIFGVLAGWTTCLLSARSGLIVFAPSADPTTYCGWIGYPKTADWFWYAAMVGTGIAGAFVAGCRPSRRRQAAWRPYFARAALGVAAVTGFDDRICGRVVPWAFLVMAAAWWWSGGRPPRAAGERSVAVPPARLPRFAIVAAVAAAIGWLATVDPAWRARSLDGLHEGQHLLYGAHALAGERAGVEIRTEYGPLYTASAARWFRVFGLTVEAERCYFLFVNALGVTLSLVALASLRPGVVALAAGVVLLAGTSTAAMSRPTFGWANALRAGLPCLALALVSAPGRGWAATAGIMLGTAALYSPEYAVAAGIGTLVLCLAARRGRDAAVAGLVAVLTATGLAVLHGANASAVVRTLAGGYAWDRLDGHCALPWPRVLRWSGWSGRAAWADSVLQQASLWFPPVLSVLALARWRAHGVRSPSAVRLAGFGVTVLVAHLPGVARPAGQQVMGAPFVALLAALLLDDFARTRRGAAPIALALVCVWAFVAPHANLRVTWARLRSSPAVAAVSDLEVPRLGRLALSAPEREAIHRVVRAVRRHVPEGGRVFAASPAHLIVPVLAGRLALAPWPSAALAASPAATRTILARLEETRPAAALVDGRGWDAPYAVEHPAVDAWLARRYRQADVFGDLRVLVPRDGPRP